MLFNFGRHDAKHQNGFTLGSLGPEVPDRFNGVFDVVIGNPPWTRLRAEKKEGKQTVGPKRNDSRIWWANSLQLLGVS